MTDIASATITTAHKSHIQSSLCQGSAQMSTKRGRHEQGVTL